MTTQNTIKKLQKKGFNIQSVNKNKYIATHKSRNDYIEIETQQNKISGINLMMMSYYNHYYSGYYDKMPCRNIKQALEFLMVKSEPQRVISELRNRTV